MGKSVEMVFADLALSRRLESAEGYAGTQYALARRLLFPDSGADILEYAGAFAAFDGIDSPITQTFGLGIHEPLSDETLDAVEKFFLDRHAPVQHEICPMAGVAALNLLVSRHYRPIEISNVLYRSVEEPNNEQSPSIQVRAIGPNEADLWANVHAQGWTSEHPELLEFLLESGSLSAARKGTVSFLAEVDGEPGAAGALCLHEGVALLAGSATIPSLRRRGLQSALLQARMQYAFHHGCDLAMMGAEAGSNSQRNAERQGFRIAYTRTKWRLSS